MLPGQRIKPRQIANARTLRKEMTDAERRLWHAVRGGQIGQRRFRRQHPIGQYIADFACVGQKMVIELDGGQHQEQGEYDGERTRFLQQQGWRVLRYWNNGVLDNLEGVLASIAAALDVLPLCEEHPATRQEQF